MLVEVLCSVILGVHLLILSCARAEPIRQAAASSGVEYILTSRSGENNLGAFEDTLGAECHKRWAESGMESRSQRFGLRLLYIRAFYPVTLDIPTHVVQTCHLPVQVLGGQLHGAEPPVFSRVNTRT